MVGNESAMCCRNKSLFDSQELGCPRTGLPNLAAMAQPLHCCCCCCLVSAIRDVRGALVQFYWAALLLVVQRGGSDLTKASPVPHTELSA